MVIFHNFLKRNVLNTFLYLMTVKPHYPLLDCTCYSPPWSLGSSPCRTDSGRTPPWFWFSCESSRISGSLSVGGYRLKEPWVINRLLRQLRVSLRILLTNQSIFTEESMIWNNVWIMTHDTGYSLFNFEITISYLLMMRVESWARS